MKRLLFILCFALFPFVLFGEEKSGGKWSGNAGMYGGTNFHKTQLGKKSHNVGGLSASVEYSNPTFNGSAYLISSYDHIFNGGKSKTQYFGETETDAYDASANETTNLLAEAGTKLEWKPDKINFYSFNYKFAFDEAKPSNWIAATGPVDETLSASFSQELANNCTRRHDAGFSFKHLYSKSGRDLQVQANASFSSNNNYSGWTTGDLVGDIVREKRLVIRQYRMTPETDNAEYKLGATYTDKKFVGVDGLDLRFLLNTKFKVLNDHTRGATLVNGEWKDSTSIREDFKYRTFTVTPSVKINYSVKFYKLDLSLSPELFSQKLDSGTKIGDIQKTPFAFICSVNNTFDPWKDHHFTLNYARSISRPSYLQVCWFLRPGSQDSNELYQGNTELKPSVTNKVKGSYKYTLKRFSTSLSLQYSNKSRKIEKVYNTKEIEGREYRVYTWINGGNNNETTATLNLAWDADHFHIGWEGYYNFFHGFTYKGSESKSSDYGCTTNIGYDIKGWSFSADGTYQSDVERSYSSLASRIVANARISKQIGKFNIYFDARDLFDMPIITTTLSEDESESRYDEYHYNRRLFVLGVDFNF